MTAKATTITLALGGEKKSGKTALVDYVLMPALGALGGKITARSEDAKKGTETVILSLPDGALDKLHAARDAGRISMANINRVHDLAQRRLQLQEFLADNEITGERLQKMLPHALQGTSPTALLAALQTDARTALAEIDAELTSLNFDLSDAA